MTRYGFAIKALPKGGKPFGDDEDDQLEDEGATEETPEAGDPSAAFEDLPPDPTDPVDPTVDPAAAPPAVDTGPPAAEEPAAAPGPPTDDSRPWAGRRVRRGRRVRPGRLLVGVHR
ncbi:hypothetical protein LUR56_40105 [Streptomyces sp. MT29]|nr:hypothetical protein [Streptomyces sp. MT29]